MNFCSNSVNIILWTAPSTRSLLKRLAVCTALYRSVVMQSQLIRHKIQAVWSPLWTFCSLRWFGVSCNLLVRSPKSMWPSTRRFYHASCFHLLTSFQEMPISLSTCSQCQNYYQMIFWPYYYCAWLASQLTWPEPHRASFKRKMRNTRPQNTDKLRAAIKETWAPITP